MQSVTDSILEQSIVTAETVDGWAHFNANRFEPARTWAETELEKDPNALSARALMLMYDWRAGADVYGLIKKMRTIAAKAPKTAIYKRCLGILLASTGQIEKAEKVFLEAIALQPKNADGIRSYADLKRIERNDPVLVHALCLYKSGALKGENLGLLCFALAKMLDDIGEYDKAMRILIEANQLCRRPYDVDAEARQLQALFEILPQESIPVSGGNNSTLPVFIVGMPRSGTTLIEAVLGRHTCVHAGGETPIMSQAEKKIFEWMKTDQGYMGTYASAVFDTPATVYAKSAAFILKLMTEALEDGETRFTDKMPHNALRLGLIARHFPRARIVYLRRHPLDSCLSNFFARFNSGHGHSFDLGALGAHYRYLAETVAIWRQLIPNPVLDVSYERFVENPERQVRRLVDFVGLDWEPSCLAPQEGQLTVFTSSMAQVREPIHKRARKRWRRYESWLDPTVESMGGMDWIKAEFERAYAAGAAEST